MKFLEEVQILKNVYYNPKMNKEKALSALIHFYRKRYRSQGKRNDCITSMFSYRFHTVFSRLSRLYENDENDEND